MYRYFAVCTMKRFLRSLIRGGTNKSSLHACRLREPALFLEPTSLNPFSPKTERLPPVSRGG